MKWIYFSLLFLLSAHAVTAQELYVFSDPASNAPAKSLTLKYAGKWVGESTMGHPHNANRQMLESQLGISKNLMFRTGITVGNMYNMANNNLKFESVNLYAKYRLLSLDGVHKHFRAAAFVKGVLSNNNLKYAEITAEGDQTAVQTGIILTQLVHKLAVSSTLALTEVMDDERFLKYGGPRNFGYRSFNYSLSAGYLVLPRSYTSYNQTNFNVYLELLGSRGQGPEFDVPGSASGEIARGQYYFVDLAPAVQLIIKSNAKLNVGYRFQLSGDAYRMSNKAFYISYERTFLNALKKRG